MRDKDQARAPASMECVSELGVWATWRGLQGGNDTIIVQHAWGGHEWPLAHVGGVSGLILDTSRHPGPQ